jgi:hypothetical protein
VLAEFNANSSSAFESAGLESRPHTDKWVENGFARFRKEPDEAADVSEGEWRGVLSFDLSILMSGAKASLKPNGDRLGDPFLRGKAVESVPRINHAFLWRGRFTVERFGLVLLQWLVCGLVREERGGLFSRRTISPRRASASSPCDV